MGEELKSCPFCGTEARLLRGGTEAVCASDGETGCNAVYFAVSDWNRRPAEDALRARAEAAEQRAEALAAALAQARAEGEAAGLARALAAIEARAAAREAQVSVAAEAGGEVDAVRLKAGELRAAIEDIRRAAADPAVTR